MDKEDYPSDSDQSDEDFCPENIDSEGPSEEDSNESNIESEEDEKPKASGVAKKKKRSRPRKRKPDNQEKEQVGTDETAGKCGSDDETEKKRSDALWADFLSDVNGSSKESGSSRSCSTSNSSNIARTTKTICNEEPAAEPPGKKKITEVFDFAGEEIKVVKEVPVHHKEDVKTESPQHKQVTRDLPKIGRSAPGKRPSGGLSSVLNAIGKKGKISVLEKSKLDWDTFKKSEGLNEELKTYNKGRDGYLDRRDFLERTDLKQFEIEKNLRQSKRSNR